MKQLSILDKLKVIFNLTINNKIFILILLLLIGLSIMFITTNKKNIKRNRKIFIGLYIFVVALIIIVFNSSIINMYESMMNNLFIVFYFPNVSIYVGAIIATNIIMLVSLFSKKTSKINKVVNSIVFFLLHYILVLILNVVSTNHLNVFNSKTLYKNTDIHSLIELSGNIFIVWIIYLILYKIINNYLMKKKGTIVVKEEVTVQEIVTKEDKVKTPKGIKVLDSPVTIKRDNRFSDNVRIIDAPIKAIKTGAIKEQFIKNIKSIEAPVIIKRDQTFGNIRIINALVKAINIKTFKEEFMDTIKSIKAPVLIKRDYSFGGIRALNAPIIVKRDTNIKEEYSNNIRSIKAPLVIKKEEINNIDNNYVEEDITPYKSTSRINNIDIRPVFNNIAAHNKTVLNTKNDIDVNRLAGEDYLTVLGTLNRYRINRKQNSNEQLLIEKEHRKKLSELMDLCGNN